MKGVLHYIERDLSPSFPWGVLAFEWSASTEVLVEADLIALRHAQFEEYLHERGEA